MSSPKRRNPPRLERRKPFKPTRTLIVVVCEGTKTEPQYLSDFISEYRNNLIEIKAISAPGAPAKIINEAKRQQSELKEKYARSKDSFDKKFQIWAVYDVDDRPDIAQLAKEARKNGINVAVSNPCFELWGILHFECQNAPLERQECQKKLQRLMPKYNSRRNKIFDYDLMRKNYNSAVGNARNICARRIEERDEAGNPSTDVDFLLEIIRKNSL